MSDNMIINDRLDDLPVDHFYKKSLSKSQIISESNDTTTKKKKILLTDPKLTKPEPKDDTDGLLNLENAITGMRSAGYPEVIIEQLIKIQNDARIYKKLDHELLNLLKEFSVIDKSVIYEKNQYSEVIKNIDSSSFVIYFKNAGIFKVYTPDILNSYFHNQVITALKKNTEIYEIVDRQKPQKIIIIIDGSIEKELNKIHDYILNFFIKYDKNLLKKDIITFKNPITNNLEILVNGIYVKNYNVKEIIIKELLDHIETEERKIEHPIDIGKIESRRICDIPNTDMFLIPLKKDPTGNMSVDAIMQYVSNITDCRAIGGNINIINIINGNNNNINSDNNTVIINDSNDDTDEIQNFVNHIKSNQPKWYTEGKWIFINKLYEKFKQFNDSDLSIGKFSQTGINRLFSKRANKFIDNHQGRAVLLLKYDKL